MTAPTDAGADVGGADVGGSKAQLRAAMRAVRRSVPDPDARSREICERLVGLDALAGASVVMAFTPIPGEPDVRAFVARCRAAGRTVMVPEDEPDPSTVDVVLVPGLAFTADGWRLGQGGGWYDRFLPMLRPDAVKVGVAFAAQIATALPVEPHDVAVDVVVTEAGP